jgi:hypothetical protein
MKPGLRFAVSCVHSLPMLRRLPLILTALILGGCVHVTMDVHATVDVNVKVDKALNDFFGDLDQKSTTIGVPAPKA